jgi:hypothetical protein
MIGLVITVYIGNSYSVVSTDFACYIFYILFRNICISYFQNEYCK